MLLPWQNSLITVLFILAKKPTIMPTAHNVNKMINKIGVVPLFTKTRANIPSKKQTIEIMKNINALMDGWPENEALEVIPNSRYVPDPNKAVEPLYK